MTNTPFISIIIPTRDRPVYVGQVLKFIKEQTFDNYEVIVSDNGVEAFCETQVAPYLSDSRFQYKRPSYAMDMCEHWDFAIEGARGQYVTVFSEKFMLRPDCLAVIAAEAEKYHPDIMTWQYDIFDAVAHEDESIMGTYHPFMKPGKSFCYSAKEELERRFSYDFPIFCRYNRYRDAYGKIYSGCMSRDLLKKVKQGYGRIFNPQSPDFTSMTAALNESSVCLDINQSLMLFLNMRGISNGEDMKYSIEGNKRFIESFGISYADYTQTLPIPGYGVGQNINIAAEYELIEKMAQHGPIKGMQVDVGALAFWASRDSDVVKDWGGLDKRKQLDLLKPYLNNLTPNRRSELEHAAMLCDTPCPTEIYHSGLEKVDQFDIGTSAEELARIHWVEGKAPPRKNIAETDISLEDGIHYFHDYSQASCKLLSITMEERL